MRSSWCAIIVFFNRFFEYDAVKVRIHHYHACLSRAVGRSENPVVPVSFGGHNLPPLVEIELTDLPKSGGAMAPTVSPGTTGLGSWKWQVLLTCRVYTI